MYEMAPLSFQQYVYVQYESSTDIPDNVCL